MARSATRTPTTVPLPDWIRPQLTQLVKEAPEGDQWLHEIKFDGFRMHARLDHREVRLLTRNGLDWTAKYLQIARAVTALPARQAYLDGELCGVRPDGVTSFSMIQLASDAGNAAGLVFFLFDLLYLDGEDLTPRPLIERKERLAALLPRAGSPLHYSDHQTGQGSSTRNSCTRVRARGTAKGLFGKVFRLKPRQLPSGGAVPSASGSRARV
jgi:ATP-dependent DNA ligase